MRILKNVWTWLFFTLALLAVRLVMIQASPDPRTVNQASSQYWTQVSISTSRGIIRDSRGAALAMSVPATSLFLDPKYWNPANAPVLKAFLKDIVSEEELARFSKPMKGRFVWVARKLPPEVAGSILSKKLEGLYALKERKRVYPQGALLAHVLGFCDIDDEGLAGLEQSWQDVLYSPPQVKILARDASGQGIDLLSLQRSHERTGPGEMVLTIDPVLQMVVEKRLREATDVYKPKWAAAVCLNPGNGEVLSMASWPTFDPNDRQTLKDPTVRLNNAIGRVYEPGSTLKPVIMSMAIEHGLVKENEPFHCAGRIRIADGVVTDTKAHGNEILPDLIINSCNVGMAQIGIRFRPRFAYDNLKQWGFSSMSGVELPGEEEGLVSTPEQWRGVVPANIAIGQGIGVTPLQLATALSAVVNGGRCVRPYIVKEAKDGKGNVVYRGREFVRDSVISKKTSDWVRSVMRRVVTSGTGKAANSPKVAVGGKTGTAQVAERGKYVKGRFVASFVGFWPAENPDHILLIVLGEPSQKGHLGGAIAAPTFRAILDDFLLLAQ